jgi:N-acetylglucosaminyldiphosphoundecaprenol N-acetyl-beta-D-mannosaminyltransferase
MARKYVNIFKIKVDSTDTMRVLRQVRDNLSKYNKEKSSYTPFYVVTPNPEIISTAQVDQKLSKILNNADLSLPDGIGLAAAHKYNQMWNPSCKLVRLPVLMGQGLVIGLAIIFNKSWLTKELQIIRGREMFLEILKVANKKKWRIFLLGGLNKNTSKKAAENISKSLKSIKFMTESGPLYDDDGKPRTDKDSKYNREIVKKINNFRPHILFVGLRCPAQEKWVYQNIQNGIDIGGGMVVGRTFEYYSGDVKSAPSWMADIGMEWVWRLFTGSTKVKRIWTAFPVFPLKVFWNKFTS